MRSPHDLIIGVYKGLVRSKSDASLLYGKLCQDQIFDFLSGGFFAYRFCHVILSVVVNDVEMTFEQQ